MIHLILYQLCFHSSVIFSRKHTFASLLNWRLSTILFEILIILIWHDSFMNGYSNCVKHRLKLCEIKCCLLGSINTFHVQATNVCIYLNIILMVIPNIVMKFNYFDLYRAWLSKHKPTSFKPVQSLVHWSSSKHSLAQYLLLSVLCTRAWCEWCERI